MLRLLCTLVVACPIGTNLGLLHLLWLLASGRLLATRGALFPGLAACGLPERAIRRAWAALGPGGWTRGQLLARWAATVAAEGRWQPHAHGGYRPVGVDVTGFWRPRLRGCPTTHDHGEAGRALPAIPVGLVARVGSAGGPRLAVPLAFVRADAADPRPAAHARRLVRAAVGHCGADAALLRDAGFGPALLQAAGTSRSVVRVAKNRTFRRAPPPPDGGRGRPPTRGAGVRPLPRADRGRPIPATAPDQRAPWQEDGALLRAAVWRDLVLPDAAPAAPACAVVALYDPRHREPLRRAAPRPVTPQVLRDLSRDRWPVEQLPLAAKQLLGAARQFVHAPETCQRWPELALLAGSVLTYVAATAAPLPTGFWDRRPPPTPGRLRRALTRVPFPQDCPLPARIRATAAVTVQLPTGFWGQRQRQRDLEAPPIARPEAA